MRRLVLPILVLALPALVGVSLYTIGQSPVSSVTTIRVVPPTSLGEIGEDFTISLEVSNVTDLYGWELKLGWNSTVLDVTGVTEGPFLPATGPTFFWFDVDEALGLLHTAGTLLGDIPGGNGNGTLVTVVFRVDAAGEGTLDVHDSTLVSSQEAMIEHTAVDGYYMTSGHDVAVLDLEVSLTEVKVTVENQGSHRETFNVSTHYTYITDPLIGRRTVTLERGERVSLAFSWSPPSSGIYLVAADISPIPGEVDTTDNSLTVTFNVE